MNITDNEIDICVDCLYLLANGEVFDSNGNDITAEHAAKVRAIWGSTELVIACDEDCEGHFSWSSCDGCGSTLGGDRHPAVYFDQEEEEGHWVTVLDATVRCDHVNVTRYTTPDGKAHTACEEGHGDIVWVSDEEDPQEDKERASYGDH